MVPCLRWDFSPAFLFFPSQEASRPRVCRCTPGVATDNELLNKARFLSNVGLNRLTPPPSCSTSLSEGNEATTRTKRALTPFVSPPPPSSPPSPHRAAPPQLGSLWHSCQPACGRSDDQGLQLQAGGSQKPQASVSARPVQDTVRAMALSLEEFVRSLDLRTLPRVLEIQSGIYFEGKHPPISWLARHAYTLYALGNLREKF